MSWSLSRAVCGFVYRGWWDRIAERWNRGISAGLQITITHWTMSDKIWQMPGIGHTVKFKRNVILLSDVRKKLCCQVERKASLFPTKIQTFFTFRSPWSWLVAFIKSFCHPWPGSILDVLTFKPHSSPTRFFASMIGTESKTYQPSETVVKPLMEKPRKSISWNTKYVQPNLNPSTVLKIRLTIDLPRKKLLFAALLAISSSHFQQAAFSTPLILSWHDK